MANPRKFSEKIALHTQKQAEETAAFEQIMKEVMGATRGAYPKRHLHITQSLGSYRGGSLPNVNQIGNNSIDLQSALSSLEDMQKGREILTDRIHRERGRHSTPHQSRRCGLEKRVDVSPYNSSYLSPPPDTNWRRTNSDSALHQSAMNPQENFNSANSPPNQRRILEVDGNLVSENEHVNSYWDSKKQQLIPLTQARPKSCEVPGINIYPSQEESGTVHVPISSNTGSLPDLTNLHFPPPLATPLDVEDQAGTITGNSFNQIHTSASSSTLSPVSTTLSPVSLSQQQHHTHILGPSVSGGALISSPGVSSGGSRHSSPGLSPSPSSRRRPHHNLTNLVIGSGSPRHHGHQHSAQQQQQQEGLTVDTNALSLETYPQPQQPQFGVYPQQQQQPQPPQPQQQQQKTAQNFVYEPTTPTSPTMPQLSMGSYRSTSPADHSCSAPTSPVSHSLSPASSPGLGSNTTLSKSPFTDTNYYVQHQQTTSAIQHQLEQFKMEMISEAVCTSSSNVGSHNNTAMFLATVDSGGGCGPPGDPDLGEVGPGGLTYPSQLSSGINSAAQDMDNAIYYSIASLGPDPHLQSPTLYSKSPVIASSHQTTPQTPQTPSSIPDIILTAPGADEPIMRQDFAKELGCAISNMSGSFDSDFFTSDDALRAGLSPIDFDGLQILTDPDMPVISDPVAEEAFQLERS